MNFVPKKINPNGGLRSQLSLLQTRILISTKNVKKCKNKKNQKIDFPVLKKWI